MPPGNPFPGPWRNSRAPWLVEPMRAFARPEIDYVVCLMASQVGKTEAQFNVLGWMWDGRAVPAMYLCPTEKLARTLAKDRLPKMIKSVESLKGAVDRRYSRPGSLEQWINGARFGMAWAGSETEVSSHPCGLVMVDERSRMDDIPGAGDPARLAGARTKNYPGGKVGIWSSPTEEGICPTYRWWAAGSKYRWCWQCPACESWFPPELEHARYPEGADYETIKTDSWMQCPTCSHQIRDEDRESIQQDYVPYTVDEDGTLRQALGVESRNPIASYWVTGFSSAVTGIGEVMYQHAIAAREGDPGEVRAVVNTYAGELWRTPGESIASDAVRARQTDVVPDGIQMVTAGVDVQQDSLYYVVRGWAPGATSHLLAHGQLLGSTEYDDVWLALSRVLEDEHLGLRPRMVLVDSGYAAAQVYEQCRRYGWSAAKGVDRSDKPFRDSLVDESATGRAIKNFRLWIYCSDTWKTWLYARIQWPEDQPGAWTVPAGIDDEYCAQVTNERVRIQRRKRVWYQTGSRHNHYMDCEVLATVAAHVQNVRALRDPVAVKEAQSTAESDRQARTGAKRQAEEEEAAWLRPAQRNPFGRDRF